MNAKRTVPERASKKKDERFEVRLTAEERDMFQGAADELGLTMASFIRMAVRDYVKRMAKTK